MAVFELKQLLEGNNSGQAMLEFLLVLPLLLMFLGGLSGIYFLYELKHGNMMAARNTVFAGRDKEINFMIRQSKKSGNDREPIFGMMLRNGVKYYGIY